MTKDRIEKIKLVANYMDINVQVYEDEDGVLGIFKPANDEIDIDWEFGPNWYNPDQDWNKLMDVCHKIINSYFDNREHIFKGLNTIDIDATFEAVAKFIKFWYDDSQKKHLWVNQPQWSVDHCRTHQSKSGAWAWPLPGVDSEIPEDSTHQGSFGAIRKHDIHTGVDIYCEDGQEVIAVEDGWIKKIENFTGPSAGSPWWNETKAIWILGESGMVVYGELEPVDFIYPAGPNRFEGTMYRMNEGVRVKKGQVIGKVKPVLKKDKGLPMTMLHLELYDFEMTETIIWNHNSPQPKYLQNPTEYLKSSLKQKESTSV